MRLIRTLFLLLILPCLTLAQGPIFQKVQQQKSSTEATSLNLVSQAPSTFMTAAIQAEVSQGVFLDLNQDAISRLQAEKPEFLQMNIPIADGVEVQVDLVINKVLTEDFILRLSSDPDNYTKYIPGEYYHGTLTDDPTTLVSISVFDNEINGMIMTDEGNYVIAKLNGSDQHIVYNDMDLTDGSELDCGMEDDGIQYHPSQLEYNGDRSPGDCVRVYIEIDDDIVTQKGGATAATDYITGMFNECITLYAQNGLTMVISEILAWTTNSPYSSTSSSGMLSDYQANTGAFNGDLSHLVSYQASGGIAAGFSGLCNSNVDNSKCFSSVDASYNLVPDYSFSVMVITHEMGHLIGSRHTHACVWNGNGTAIDGCAGQTEGSCSLPGSPSGGGTIMSYCHLTTGINFNLGFGDQPRAVIQNSVNNASCTSPCDGGGGPTCFDGVQNGEETGVDCGGPDCAACPTPCNDNLITISITLDNYPEETSWNIKNSSGTTVASGGTYGSQPDGSTVVETYCAIDGCYDFTILDAYGDGICCSYGNGSYTVTSGGSTLASGGSFGSSEITNFCLGGGPAPTCTDGIQNGNETGVDCGGDCDACPTCNDGVQNGNETDVDCGGPDCPACPTCNDGIQNGDETGVDCGGPDCAACPTGGGEILASYFETGWDGWTDGGSDCYRYSGARSYEGSYSIRIRDNSGSVSAMTSSALNLTGNSAVEVKFYFYPNSMENGEDFWLRYYNGSSWTTVASWVSGTHFNNNTFYTTTVTLTAAQYNLVSNGKFRFQCDASSNADRVYIDQVTVTGIASGLIDPNAPMMTIEETYRDRGLEPENNNATISHSDLSVYPNPARDVLNIDTEKVIESVQVISLSGQVMRTIQGDSNHEEINVADLQSGMYYILIKAEGELMTRKFVKM